MIIGLFLALIILIVFVTANIRSSNIKSQESFESYVHGMHYMESLVYRIAYEEGSVTPERVTRLVPQIAHCKLCQKHLHLVWQFGVERGDLLVDVNSNKAVITRFTRLKVKHAESFTHLGTAWILPKSKIKLSHAACHAPPALIS